MAYSIDSTTDGCYPGTTCLVNKLGIQDELALAETEAAVVLGKASLLDQQPLSVESASYVVQDQQYKALFPDMLQATVRNGTGETVTKAVVAFAAWDINGNPVAIEAKYDFIRGFYIREVTFQDLAVPAGETFGERYGFKIEESCRVARVKAIAVGCETSGGTTWTNPCYEAWLQLYEGVGFSEHRTVEVPLELVSPSPSPT